MPSNYESLSEDALLSLGSMEGVYELPVVVPRPAAPEPAAEPLWPGCSAAAAVAAAALALHYLPFAPFRQVTEHGIRRPLSASILAIVIGVAARNLIPGALAILPGCKAVVRRVLPLTIVLTGAGLHLGQIAAIGAASLGITAACIGVALAAAWYLGRMLSLRDKTSLLIGAGTAICGTSAIVAVAPLIDAEDQDVTLSAAAINVLGLALMFALPAAGVFFGMSSAAFGVWAGVSIHAVPQVVAAASAFSDEAAALGTLVKLARVTLLAPLMLILTVLFARRHGGAAGLKVRYSRLIPPFVWGFLALALLNTLSLFPALQFPERGLAIPLAPALSETGNLALIRLFRIS
jgi:uncharacterized integral membrane protein (TIGR00698 family)